MLSWFMGLFFDLLTGAPLGVHAFIFTLLAYFILRFNVVTSGSSDGRKLLLVFVAQTLDLSIQYLISAHYHVEPQTWRYWLPMLVTTLFWPAMVRVLQNRRDQLRVI